METMSRLLLGMVMVIAGLTACNERGRAEPPAPAPAPTPEVSKPTASKPTAPAVKELADTEQIESLLNKFHARMCAGFHVVSRQLVAEGVDEGKPAQLVGYKATAQCFGRTLKLCGKIALSLDSEWKTYSFVSGFNFIPGQGLSRTEGGCDDESKLGLMCFGCGETAVLSVAMKKNGFRFTAASDRSDAN